MEINKIYCESNLETMKRMPDNFVDYVLTSPPYNVNTESLAKYKDFKDNLTQDNYFEQQKELITELLRINFKRGTQSNIFKILNSHSNPFAKEHKAIMPLDIPRYFMINFGNENDIWYDPYMGTGTTAVAAIEERKNWLGSEISKEYLDIANKRLQPYLDQITLF